MPSVSHKKKVINYFYFDRISGIFQAFFGYPDCHIKRREAVIHGKALVQPQQQAAQAEHRKRLDGNACETQYPAAGPAQGRTNNKTPAPPHFFS